MSTITSWHNPSAELQDNQTGDYQPNSNKIERILYHKIKKFSSRVEKNVYATSDHERNTEYVDFKKDLNLEISDVVETFYTDRGESIYLKTQKWLGHVIEISDQTISAKLEDINNPTTYEIGEFEIDDIAYEDRELIRVGAGFYFSVGQAYDKNGQIEKKSLIRFQRVNPWDEYTFDTIIDEADNLYDKLKWD